MVQLRAAFAAYAKFTVTTSQFCEPGRSRPRRREIVDCSAVTFDRVGVALENFIFTIVLNHFRNQSPMIRAVSRAMIASSSV
jgi:hypothetical protein